MVASAIQERAIVFAKLFRLDWGVSFCLRRGSLVGNKDGANEKDNSVGCVGGSELTGRCE